MEEQGTDLTRQTEGIDENKTYLRSPVRYLRELSVVVIGVAITFLVSGWVTNHRERKELSSHLSAVKEELESNLITVTENYKYYDKLLELSRFIQSKNPEDHKEEEIWEASRIDGGPSVIERFYYNMPVETVSFDALIQSGTAKHIRDKDMWRTIMKSYKSLDELKHESDTYMVMKVNYFFNALRETQVGSDVRAITSPEMKAFYNFYSASYTFHDVFDKTFESINEALSYL